MYFSTHKYGNQQMFYGNKSFINCTASRPINIWDMLWISCPSNTLLMMSHIASACLLVLEIQINPIRAGGG